MKSGKPKTYKCSICHKKGHNARGCGKVQNFQVKKSSKTVGEVNRGSMSGENELTQIHRVHANLQALRSDAEKAVRDKRWSATEDAALSVGDIQSGLVERCVKLMEETMNGFEDFCVINAELYRIMADKRSGRIKLVEYLDKNSDWQDFDSEKEFSYHGRKKGFVIISQSESVTYHSVHTFNEWGYLHSFHGNPASVGTAGSWDTELLWCKNDLRHNLECPAQILTKFPKKSSQEEIWWANGIQTEHPKLCERAILPDLTDGEFYELCTHEDYVVRQLAAHNPHCPAEWRTVVNILSN